MTAHKNYLLNDKFPKAIKNATSTSDGLMSSEDKARVDSIFEFGLLTPVTHVKDGIMVTEDKIKLDNIEEGATRYIHPDDENTRHVSDTQINRWDTQVKYTNDMPMPAGLGGLSKGSTFNNIDYNDLFTKLLYPYIEPTVSKITVTPGTTILEKGNSFTLSTIKFTIDTPSLRSTSSVLYNFKKNNTTFKSVELVDRNVNVSVSNTIDTNATISVEVVDSFNEKTKSFTLITYNFINPFYYGIMNSSDTLTEALLKSKTKLLQTKGAKTLKFTTDNQKMLFAYPKEYGKLKVIYDANNFNVLNTFKISEISIIGNDKTSVSYYVYINDASTVTNYNMQFQF